VRVGHRKTKICVPKAGLETLSPCLCGTRPLNFATLVFPVSKLKLKHALCLGD
jgi:hypothetical protein